MDLVDFTLLYGVHSQGYCHLVVATMAIISFGAMCRYSDVCRLKWGNIKFESNLSSFEISFEIRKKSQFRQGNKVLVAATKDAICPLKLLIKLKDLDVNNTPSSPIFCGFNGRLIAKNPQKRHLSMYPSSTRNNTLDICLFGLAKSLAFRHKSLNHNMVLNRVEAEGLHRR
jgi:integrase